MTKFSQKRKKKNSPLTWSSKIDPFEKFLRKVELDRLEGIIIVPCWSTQIFFSDLIKLLIDIPISIRWRDNVLHHPLGLVHPIGPRLHLTACLISWNPIKRRVFRLRLLKSLATPGLSQHTNNITLILRNGLLFVADNQSVKIQQV